MEESLENLKKARIENLQALKNLGVEPFPSNLNFTRILSAEALEKNLGNVVCVAGRVVAKRNFGAIIFFDIADFSGKIQALAKKSELTKHLNEIIELLDIGDFIEVKGTLFKTASRETTIQISDFRLLTKSIRPLPTKHFGLKDDEERYRQRYVDFAINPELRNLFVKKAIFWNSIRTFLTSRGFLEVETPVLENIAGGADAEPFKTHHNALDCNLYLRISMGELWQKRLMVGGFEKTFEIGRQFRNEGISREHLQDYTQVEFYWAYANYNDSMRLVEEMFKEVAKKTFGTTFFTIGGVNIDLGSTWKVIDYTETIMNSVGINIQTATKDQIIAKLLSLKDTNIPVGHNIPKSRFMDLLWKHVRKDVTGPAFLVNHPVEVSPLAKRNSEDPSVVERYQIILAGSEMGNGYSELNDPQDQEKRFKEQQSARDAGDFEAQMYDADFVRALEYGMPPVTGFGLSERLFAFLAGKSVRECVMFPLQRPEDTRVKTTSFKNSIKNTEGFSISDDLRRDFPGMFFAYCEIKDLRIKKADNDLEKLKKTTIEDKSTLSLEEIGKIKPIKNYRELLSKTGVDFNSKRPYPEALLRRIVQGKGLYNINTAVDAYNIAVIETGVGLGGFDANKIGGCVELRYSKNGEEARLLGDDKVTRLKDGQIVYSDQEKILTININYRDIEETKITSATKDILLFADGAPDIPEEVVTEALNRGTQLIKKYCGGSVGNITVVR
jgi:lysyl-tRNA synthetase class 2